MTNMNSSEAFCYKLLKENLEFEEYLNLLSDIDKIIQCTYWMLPVNSTKYKIIIFTKRKMTYQATVKLQGKDIEIVGC